MRTRVVLACLTILILLSSSVAADTATIIPELDAPVQLVRDSNGVPHIFAGNEHDLFFVQGWVHAEDRLFQMDLLRRRASGTLAEVLGVAALPSDVELRTIGLRRAAALSEPLLLESSRAALQAYTDGVNAIVASHPLPPEYGALGLTQVDPWTVLDSLTIGKGIAFSLSFDLDISRTATLLQYETTGDVVGFDGTALFSEDLFRSAPFDPASTIPDSSQGASAAGLPRQGDERSSSYIEPKALQLGQNYVERVRDLPLFREALALDSTSNGSNEWVVSGQHTASGFPLLANDPHLPLDTPATVYPIHLSAPSINVIGSSFAGTPFVALGHNESISWGATVNPMDVTDTFQEAIVVDFGSPSGLSTVYQSRNEHVIPIPEVFRYNQPGTGLVTAPPNAMTNGTFIPAATLIVPRRNQGPIVSLDLNAGIGLSVQYTGFSGTRELDALATWNRARNMDDFVTGLQWWDFGSQNFVYADTGGNIAYFTSAEMPVREDFQAGTVNGLPPFFIRNGSGGNEWLPVSSPQPGHAVPFEILPFGEMPQTVNPPTGYIVNANNDPAGTTLDNNALNQLRPGGGIFYLSPGYDIGTRAGRITQMIDQKLATGASLSREDMMAMQADTVMLDAQVLVPYILAAFGNATVPGAHSALAALAANPGVVEAADRLSRWDFATPTGVPEGYDASDEDGLRLPPSDAEIEASISATIYSVWRGQMLQNTIGAVVDSLSLPLPDRQREMVALRHLLDSYSTSGGVGASGLNFFNVPGVDDPAVRRDILLLKSLADALDLLAGESFVAAFNGSTDQNDYRWGRLHRIVFDHPLGEPFSIPPSGGAFSPPFPDLPGIPTDGGFGVVDESSHSSFADGSNDFMFGHGPSRRFVVEMVPGQVMAKTSLPGGVSGMLGSPLHNNLLPMWLTNDTFELVTSPSEARLDAYSVTYLVPSALSIPSLTHWGIFLMAGTLALFFFRRLRSPVLARVSVPVWKGGTQPH